MKIRHTSTGTWAASKFGRKRYDEFAAFQDWQADMIEVYQIDLLPFH